MALVDYLHSYLGGLSSQLGWDTVSGSYDFIVSETIRLYGVSTEAEATDLNKLYTIGKMVLWETVLRELSMDYDYTANGASFKRSQMYQQIKENLDTAITEAMVYLDGYNKIHLGSLGGDELDPYSNTPYSER